MPELPPVMIAACDSHTPILMDEGAQQHPVQTAAAATAVAGAKVRPNPLHTLPFNASDLNGEAIVRPRDAGNGAG